MNRTTGVQHSAAVVCMVGSTRVALPLASVIEVMRPLPIEPVVGRARGVLGVSVIRGAPTVVVDAATVLGQEAPEAIGRFVTLRTGARTVALAVQDVLGVQPLAALHALPPLLAGADGGVVAQIAARDRALLAVLEAAHLVDAE